MKKVFLPILGGILAVAVLTVCVLSFFPVDPQTGDVAENGGGMFVGDGDGDGASELSLTAIEIPRAEYEARNIAKSVLTAIEVKATVTPPEAENNRLNWSLAWEAGTGGTFGEGKDVSEYVTGSASDDTLTYTIQCSQAFGETIILRSEIRGNPKIFKTKEVEFLQGYSDITAEVTYSGAEQANLSWNLTGTSSQVQFPGAAKTSETFKNYYAEEYGTTTFTVTTHLSEVYTVAGTVGEVKAEVKVKQAYLTAITDAYGTTDASADTYKELGTGTGESASFGTKIAEILYLTDFGALEFAPFKYNLSVQEEPLVTIRLTTTVNGHTKSKEIELTFDPASYGTFASGLEWADEGAIVIDGDND